MTASDADGWLQELAQLRAGPGSLPTATRFVRLFAVREPAGFSMASPFAPPERRRIRDLTAALYAADEVDAAAELLVPLDPDDAPFLPRCGYLDVHGVAAPGHAMALTDGSRVVYCSGPVTVPQLWPRRYRNRPWRWPRSGAWDASIGSALVES